MTPLPAENPDATTTDDAVRRFPEGSALSVAAILGAVIVLAALLLGRSLFANSGETVEITADEITATTVSPDNAPEPDIGTDTQDDEEAEPEPSESDVEPDPEVEPDTDGEDVPLAVCPDGVDSLICDAAAYVQQVRGRAFKTFPTVEIMTDTDFDAALLADFGEYEEELAADEVVLSALGLIDPDVSYVQLFRDALEVGVVGFYDPDTGQLVLRGEDLGLYAQNVLVHELTHALDDQWFDLGRDVGDAEAEYGFSAVIEGNASRVDQQWRATLDANEQALLLQEELGALSPADLQRYLALPVILQQLQLSPYQDGGIYIDDLLQAGGEEAVDQALTTPPSSSEEVLHPLTDRERDPEIDIEQPPAAGEVVTEGRLGELLIRLWLGRVAGDGWGGDRFVAWSQNGQNCLTVDIAADSERDLTDISTAAEIWAADQPDRRSVSAIAADLVRISGCQ